MKKGQELFKIAINGYFSGVYIFPEHPIFKTLVKNPQKKVAKFLNVLMKWLN